MALRCYCGTGGLIGYLSKFLSQALNNSHKRAELDGDWSVSLPNADKNRIMTNQPLTGGIDLSCDF
jgi:hypothetical protein